MKLTGESVTDEEALTALEKARADWIPGRPEAVSAKQGRLQQAIGFLDEGLKNHFAFEENVFPSLLGDTLARAITLEHEGIRRELEETKPVAADIRLEGLSREDLLAEEARWQQRIDVVSQLVEEHARKEELILDMVRRVLEESG
jgi:hypothetical protein